MDKKIPISAGMAGGSADAAAVLFGVNKMFGLGLSMTELEERGVKLGADVPYCLMRGTVLAEGIGEKLTPLLACPKCFVLLAKPPISVSTKMVYEKLDALEITEHPDIDGILNGLARKNIHKVAECMGNVLEQVTIPVYPVIEQIKNVMKEGGAMNAMMSGSGPTVFGLFEDRQSARRAAQKIKEQKLAKQVYVTSIHQAKEEVESMEQNLKVNENEYLPLRDVVFNTLRQATFEESLNRVKDWMEIRLQINWQ